MHKSYFTLVEVMMAVLLLATVAATLMKVVNNSLHQLSQAQIEVFKERVIYEAIAVDAISEDDTQSSGNLDELDGVVWFRSESDAYLDDELLFKQVQVNLQSDKLKTKDVAIVIERID